MLLTAATSLVSAASYVANWVSKEANYWLGLRRHKKALLTLTRDEKAVLQKFIGGGETTRYAVLSDGIVAGLAARNILVRTSNLSGRHQTFPFNLQPWAREHLTKHPELLDE